MNTVDNGVKQLIDYERVIKEKEVYFLVTFIDFYNQKRQKKFMSIDEIEKKRWVE